MRITIKLHTKGTLVASAVVALMSVFTTSSYAVVSTTTYADQAMWNPLSANGFSLIDQTTATPQASLTVNSAAASAGVANNIYSQTFTPTTTFNLGAFTIYAAGAPVSGMSVHLFQVTYLPNGLPGGWATTGGYNILQNCNTNDMLNPGNNLANLASSGELFNYSGTATKNYLEFDLSGSSQVTLQAGTSYAFELWAPSTAVANGLYWCRGAEFYANGNIYGANAAGAGYVPDATQLGVSMNNVAGGTRDGGLAVYAVPEPSIFALAGLGAALLVLRRRNA